MTRPPLPPSSDAPDWEAIGRFLTGESSAEEASVVAAWLAAHPEDAAVVARVNAATDALRSDDASPIDTEAALARVLARRAASPALPADVRVLRGASPRRRWWASPLAAAAGLAVVAGSAWWLTRTSDAGGPERLATTVLATATGERDSLALPDGSSVILGPGSTLSYAPSYGTDARTVTLRGEAYFEVARDDARPFTVIVPGAQIVDLGTAFAVRADSAGDVTVAVTSGRVRLEAQAGPDSALELAAGQGARLSVNAATPEAFALDTVDATAFTRGALVLRDTPVRDLPTLLQRWYGVTLVIDAALSDRRVSATFTNESVDAVVSAIALSLGARGSVRGDTAQLQRDVGR